MGISTRRILWVAVALTISIEVTPAFGSAHHKCKKPACDINAIGYRKLVIVPSVKRYPIQNEKELGDKHAAALETRVRLVSDEKVASYVDRVAQHIKQNSDADVPINVRIIRSSDVSAFTLPAGHLYLTTGLILKLQSEGELASVLARGIAHTALHSVMRLKTRANLMEIVNLPNVTPDNMPPTAIGVGTPLFGLLKFQRQFELEADYFGIQYVYKSGYDADCFLRAVQAVWQPDPSKSLAKALSPFPPVAERVKPLREEIEDILPKRSEDVISTSEFDGFIERLRNIPRTDSPSEDALPRLIRHDLATE